VVNSPRSIGQALGETEPDEGDGLRARQGLRLTSANPLFMSQSIFVSGADGFIGSHLVEALVRDGENVRAFVCYNSFNSWGWLDTLPADVLSSIDVVSGDIRDPYGLKNAMRGCTRAYHLAALIAIPFSYHSPDLYVDTNIRGTLNILQAARELKLDKLVHTSTSEVYGTAKFVPITEDHPLQGQSPYSATKIGADQLALAFHRSFGLPVAVIRPFNTYGPRQSLRAVIPTIITQILSGKVSIKLGAVTPTRDFNYVDDTVDGFKAMMRSDQSIGEVINIGNGSEISVRDTATLIADLMGVKIELLADDERMRPASSEVERLWADNSKAKRVLNWQPQFPGTNGLKEGLRRTISWFREEENLKRYKTHLFNL
jgi:NAD dependent epimerase/dehydratase